MMLLEVRDSVDPEAAKAMLCAVEPHAVDGATVEDMTAGCTLLDILEGGAVVGAVAVEIEGEDATITAGTSKGEAAYQAMGLVENLLKRAGVKRVAFETRRIGLVDRMWNIGYEVQHCRMFKEIA